MASSRRKRRPGGHPARIAEKRRQKREQREARAGKRTVAAADAEQLAKELVFARGLIDQAERLADARGAQLWASDLLGVFWEQRRSLPPDMWEDAELHLGEPVLEKVASIGGLGALTAMLTIAEVAETELSFVAKDHAKALRKGGLEAPAWTDDLPRELEITGAAAVVDEPFHDATTSFIEARYPDGATIAVGVTVEHNIGDVAVAISAGDSLDGVREAVGLAAEEDPGPVAPRMEVVDPALAAARIDLAMDATDTTLGIELEEDYGSLRSLALLIVASVSGIGLVDRDQILPPHLAPEERQRASEQFLASPEAGDAGLGNDPDASFHAELIVDYCCDWGRSDLLRWSPMRSGIFMSWAADKVVGVEDLESELPPVLAAWVRYSHRLSDVPQEATELTLEAIEATKGVLGEGPSGPFGEILEAARAEGVELSDEGQLQDFIERWNAGRGAVG